MDWTAAASVLRTCTAVVRRSEQTDSWTEVSIVGCAGNGGAGVAAGESNKSSSNGSHNGVSAGVIGDGGDGGGSAEKEAEFIRYTALVWTGRCSLCRQLPAECCVPGVDIVSRKEDRRMKWSVVVCR